MATQAQDGQVIADRSEHRVGLVGAGLMGIGIATNLAAKGWRLTILEHAGNQRLDDLIAQGVETTATPAALARASDIVIVCVTGSPQVEDVLTRADGVLAGLREGALVIDCSTAIPASTHALAARVEAAGGRFIDAPMTRTPREAMEGRLNLIVGGEAGDFAFALPLFEAFAENIMHVGPVGSGHTMKLVHNYVSLGFSAVLSEAAAAADQAGIRADVLVDVLARGGGKGVVLDRIAPWLTKGDDASFRFSIANACKDIGYYAQMADDLGVERRAADAILALLKEQVDAGHGGEMMPELIRLIGKS